MIQRFTRHLFPLVAFLLLFGAAAVLGGGQFEKAPSAQPAGNRDISRLSHSQRAAADENQTFRLINNFSLLSADTVLHWDGANSSGVGDDVNPWRGIVVFTPTELGPFEGTHQISEVWAWMRSPLAWDSVLVEIYEGVSINPGPPATISLGTRVYAQNITAEITTLDDWTVHSLSAPVPIQSGMNYAAVIFIEQNQTSPPAFPLGIDAGPMVPLRGGWVTDPTLPDGAQLADFGINNNWNIRMGIERIGGGGQGVVLEEGFEGAFPPAGWQVLSPDGGSGWNQQTIGTTPVPGWTSGTVTGPPGGGAHVAFCTWATGGPNSNDQWLITPQITNVQADDSLHFWMRYWPNNFADTVDVRISTTGGGDPANFDLLVQQLGFGAGGDTTVDWREYSFAIGALVPAGSNIYIGFREHVQDNFNDGASISLDNLTYTTDVVNAIDDGTISAPGGFVLRQNYPNPFNPTTTIDYVLPVRSRVSLEIFNTLGQKIRTLVEATQPAGAQRISWDGRDENGAAVTSGIYLYKLRAGGIVQSRKMILLR